MAAYRKWLERGEHLLPSRSVAALMIHSGFIRDSSLIHRLMLILGGSIYVLRERGDRFGRLVATNDRGKHLLDEARMGVVWVGCEKA
jgi:hypothetical protein